MDINIETITPAEAGRLLASQVNNRRLNRTTVNAYVEAMKAGQWLVNGEAIKLDPSGGLIDGQHRLTACVIADRPFKSVVVRGLNGQSFATFDQGKPRSVADVLQLAGYPYCNVLGTVVRLGYGLRTNGGRYQSKKINAAVLLAFIRGSTERERGMVEAAKEGTARAFTGSFFTGGIAGTLWYLTHVADHSMADGFFADLKNVASEPSNPASVLRARISLHQQKATGYLAQMQALALAIKAWNAYREGRALSRIVYTPYGPRGEEYPQVSGLDLNAL